MEELSLLREIGKVFWNSVNSQMAHNGNAKPTLADPHDRAVSISLMCQATLPRYGVREASRD
jgi:hypothetical protein